VSHVLGPPGRARPPGFGARLTAALDIISTAAGWLAGWLVVPMTVAVAWEVVARYVFNAPTRWAGHVSTTLYGSQFMLAAAYTLRQGGHIRTDVFYERWSPRTRALVDAVSYLGFFFPGMLGIFYAGVAEAWQAWRIGERAGLWPAYLFKGVIPFTAVLLTLQGLSELIKSMQVIRRGPR
jgi:TRAP-type mannitol/chloroaromatic compound transport system permease small subunit